jgi:hypothetical protein
LTIRLELDSLCCNCRSVQSSDCNIGISLHRAAIDKYQGAGEVAILDEQRNNGWHLLAIRGSGIIWKNRICGYGNGEKRRQENALHSRTHRISPFAIQFWAVNQLMAKLLRPSQVVDARYLTI